MPKKFDFSNKSSRLQVFRIPNGIIFDEVTDNSAVRDKLKEAIELNKSLGQELGVENLQRLYAERALLKKEGDLLRESEQGRQIRFAYSNYRHETDHGRSGETEKRG